MPTVLDWLIFRQLWGVPGGAAVKKSSFGSACTKIGTIQRLAWPLRKDDRQILKRFPSPGAGGGRGGGGGSGASRIAQAVKNRLQCGDPGLIPGSGRSAGEGIGHPLQYSQASLVAQLVKNPPAMWETWVRSLGWEYPLEKGKATHSSVLAWRIPCSYGVAKSRARLSDFHFHLPMQETQETWIQSLIQEDTVGLGKGKLLQYSCLKKFHRQRSLVD